MFTIRASRRLSVIGSSLFVGSYLPIPKKMAYSDAPLKKPLTSMKDKVVLITGASAGIGKCIAWSFAEEGSNLILMGRRENLLVELKGELLQAYPKLKVHTVAMSVTDMESIAALPTTLPDEFKSVDVLVNNAGLALGVASVEDNLVEDAKMVLDTNIMGVVSLCSAFLPGMKERNFGHIVNIGSVAGHYAYAQGSIYNASKYAIRGFSEAARHDLQATPIRVTHISPGLVGNTEFSNTRFRNDDTLAAKVYQNIEALQPEDVADNVIYAVTRPAHVQVAELMCYCTNQSGPKDLTRAGPSLGAK